MWLLARFWMRCGDSTANGFTTFVYEMAVPEFDKAAEVRLKAGKEWTQCFVPFRATVHFPAGDYASVFAWDTTNRPLRLAGWGLLTMAGVLR